jgi:cobalamin-dependent methionine synthase I
MGQSIKNKIKELKIIGESINDSVPPTHELFEKKDMKGIQEVALKQAEGGAAYIDVNVGMNEPDFMAHVVKKVQEVVDVPLAIDSPDLEIQRAGLTAYDPARAGNRKPVLNSISELRLELLDLYSVEPFIPMLMASERSEDGKRLPNKTGTEIHATAKRLVEKCRQGGIDLGNDELIIDPGLAPIGADYENITRATLEGVQKIHEDPDLSGIHMSVGLSNFAVMLPKKTPAGFPVKTILESAFLTLTVPLGMDYVVGNINREYQMLDEDHPALVALKEAVEAGGFSAIERIQKFLKS